ncbi:MAG: polysaccharide biosynthesis tyrosine autokinase [Acidimicrobiia bacterium]
MDETNPELDLRGYATVLRRRKWTVLAVTVATVGVALAWSFTSTKVYAASADILLSDSQQESVFGGTPSAQPDPARLVATQIQVLESRPLEQQARRRLGPRASRLGSFSAAGVGQTDVVRVTAQSTDPAIARDAANAFANVYVAARHKQAVDALLAVNKELEPKLKQARAQLEDLDGQIATATAAVPPDTAKLTDLRSRRDTAAQEYAVFKQKADQVQVDAALRSGGAQVITKAELPTSPVTPKPVRNGILALVLGLMLGLGLAFLREHLDDTVKTPDDLERFAPGVPFLGEIPAVGDRRSRERVAVIALDQPTSHVSEAYRALRTSVQIVGLRQPVRTLLVTSPAASEGKTTTVTNLGITLAKAGKHVTLVDLDLRRPRLTEAFGVPNDTGFVSVLIGDAPLSTAAHDVDVSLGAPLQVLGTGPVPPNPAELLGTDRVAELLGSLCRTADTVLIDSPPLLPVTDALVLSRRVDGVVLVVSAGTTRGKHLARAVEQLQSAEAPLIGMVLNGVSHRTGHNRGYGYGYGYGHTPHVDLTAPEPASGRNEPAGLTT